MKFDALPSRGKITADGEETQKHNCGGRCYIFYDENAKYHVECETCGVVKEIKARSLDSAIRIWNMEVIG
jgi:Fe2+ or Zn2+ uptake regulation protein